MKISEEMAAQQLNQEKVKTSIELPFSLKDMKRKAAEQERQRIARLLCDHCAKPSPNWSSPVLFMNEWCHVWDNGHVKCGAWRVWQDAEESKKQDAKAEGSLRQSSSRHFCY